MEQQQEQVLSFLNQAVDSGDYWNLRFDLNKAVKQRFDAEGISIPFPQRDVHLHETAD